MHEAWGSFAKEWIEGARSVTRCDWCGREKAKNRRGLCRHCDGVRKDLESVEKQATESPGAFQRFSNFILEWEVAIARQKKSDCIFWGRHLQGILHGAVDSLTLEGWFRQVAQRIARDRDIHYNTATPLSWTFTPEQRQVLAYMFWQIFGEEASHNRRSHAQARVQREHLRTEDSQTETCPSQGNPRAMGI